MQTYISYVIQGDQIHRHESEIITRENPSYSFSEEPMVSDIMKWANQKEKSLKHNEKLVIVSMYKL